MHTLPIRNDTLRWPQMDKSCLIVLRKDWTEKTANSRLRQSKNLKSPILTLDSGCRRVGASSDRTSCAPIARVTEQKEKCAASMGNTRWAAPINKLNCRSWRCEKQLTQGYPRKQTCLSAHIRDPLCFIREHFRKLRKYNVKNKQWKAWGYGWPRFEKTWTTSLQKSPEGTSLAGSQLSHRWERI